MRRTRQCLPFRGSMCWAAFVLLGGSANAEPPRTDRLGDPLPEGAIARLGTMRLRHDVAVSAVAFAPDGKTLASGDWSGVVRIWETASGRELHCLRGSQSQFSTLAYSPDGKLLAWGGRGGIDLWNPTTGAKRGHLGQGCQYMRGLAFSPDGKTLIALMDGPVHWWDVATQTRLPKRDGECLHDDIRAAAFSPDGKTLIVADNKKRELRRYDTASGKSLGKLCDSETSSLAYSPDGKRLALAADRSCLVCDAVSGEILECIKKPCQAVAYAPDGRTIAGVGMWSSNPWLFELPRRELRWLDSEQVRKEQKVLAFSPDGKLLATAGEDQLVRFWNVRTGKECDLLDGEACGERQFAISGNGKVLAALDADRSIRVWNTDNGKMVCRWNVAFPHSSSLALSPDGTLLTIQFFRRVNEHVLEIFDARTGRRCWDDTVNERIVFAAISDDGSLLAAGPDGKDIELWGTKTGKRVGRLTGRQRSGVAGAFTPDGKTLITASLDHMLCVWDVTERRERQRLKGHGGGATVSRISFSADGTRLATGGDDGRICLWDPRNGRRLGFWATDHQEGVTCLALSPDGRTILANNDGPATFCLRDTTTGKASPSIHGHRDTIVQAAFRADGRTCVTASRDGTALVWDVAALRRRKPPHVTPVPVDCYGDPLPPGTLARLGSIRLHHKDGVDLAAFSPDGKILAAAEANGEPNLRLWDVRSGKALHRLSEGRTPWIGRIGFSPDGKLLAGMCSEGIRLWDVASGAYLGVAVRHKNSISTFAFSPDGSKIAAADGGMAGGKDFKIYLWDLDSGELLRVFDGHQSPVHEVAFTADDKTLLSGDGSEVCLWDVANGKQRHRHQRGGTLAPNGATMALADEEKLHVCDTITGRELWSTDLGKGDYTYTLDGKRLVGKGEYYYSLDGKRLLICSSNQPFRLYDSATGKELHRSDRVPEQLDPMMRLCLSADGATFATTDSTNIHLWDTKTGRERRPFAGHRSSITCMSFAPDGRTLVSASARGSVLLWDAVIAMELRVLRESGEMVTAVVFSPDGRRIACGDRRNVVHVWDAATGAEVGRFADPTPKVTSEFESVRCLAFSADGRTLAIGGGEGALLLWETTTNKPPRRLPTAADVVLALTFSCDGQLTALLAKKEAGSNRVRARLEIVVWDVATERGPRRLSAWSDNIPWSIAVSPDGKCLAVNPSDPAVKNSWSDRFQSDRIRLYELATGKQMSRFSTKWGQGSLAFSPNGRMLLAGGSIWDVASGQRVGEIVSPVETPSPVAYSTNGRLVASIDANTILLHSFPQNPRQAPGRTQRLSEGDFRALWNDLSSTDASVAWHAVYALVAVPRQSAPFLQSVLRPHSSLDKRRLNHWLADLDSDVFAERDEARRALSKLGELCEPALRRTLEAKPSLEVRRQVLLLLEQIEVESRLPDSLRLLRAMSVLENIGTADCVALLRRLAGGAPEARRTREAAAALARLKRRTDSP